MSASAPMRELVQAPPATSARPLRQLYGEIVAHYEACQTNPASLSDTWVQTLKHRGTLYAYDEMLEMLAPGNKVNFWIDDLHYLIDPTVVDQRDPIVRRLLELGESDFGAPRKDLRAAGRRMSSGFLHHLVYAAKIIRLVEAQGIQEPAILEIGGGLGGVAYLLRQYFQDRLTLYLVDIPETLMIQEWYLRATAPEAATAYKATRAPVVFQRGGLNFINAYVLASQDMPFDVAINADSMQEMTRETAQAYIRYFEKNMTPGGFWYFQNHYGHSTLSVPEPSEYALDAQWTLHAAEMAYQMECCAESEQARFIFLRTTAPEDPTLRAWMLRVLWNGFVSGRLPNNPSLVSALAAMPRQPTPAAASAALAQALRTHQVPIDVALAEALQQSLYFPPARFVSLFQTEPVWAAEEPALAQRHMEAVWRVQSAVLQQMRAAAGEAGGSASSIARQLAALCQRQLLSLPDTATSEYWSGYVACLLMVLGQPAPAKQVLLACAAGSANPYWLVRFSYLLSRFGDRAAAQALLRQVPQAEALEYYLALKYAELEAACESLDAAGARLRRLEEAHQDELPRLAALARTAARTGALDVMARAFAQLWKRFPEARIAQAWQMLRAASTGPSADAVRTHLQQRFAHEPLEAVDLASAGAYGVLLVELGRQDEGRAAIAGALSDPSMDYYRLGHLARLLQQARLPALAGQCLERSVPLRPESALHFEFVADVYFAGQQYAPARAYYAKSLAIRPYLRHTQAKALYSALPEALRQSGVFGQPAELGLVFQRKQDFYHDIGLSNK